MAEQEEIEDQKPKKLMRLAVILGLVLAIIGGAGGFYAVQSGLILAEKPSDEDDGDIQVDEILPEIEFVKIDPIIVSLPSGQSSRLVRFSAQLEVGAGYRGEVESVLPRIVDVLNSYLRAVEPADFEQPAALVKLRAQMLRRVQIVTGKGRVRDLLIMEFVLT